MVMVKDRGLLYIDKKSNTCFALTCANALVDNNIFHSRALIVRAEHIAVNFDRNAQIHKVIFIIACQRHRELIDLSTHKSYTDFQILAPRQSRGN